MTEKRSKRKGPSIFLRALFGTGVLLLIALAFLALGPISAQPPAESTGTTQSDTKADAAPTLSELRPLTGLTPEERFERIENILVKMMPMVETMVPMVETLRKAEERTLFTKILSSELVGYVKLMVAALIAIAIGFPLTIWWMSRKRILGLSSLSDEVSATLVVVEERQAKLANILKDIQGEIDYVQSMSVPDLKNLIAQAEKYLKQNETDLEKAGTPKTGVAKNDADPARNRTN